MARLCEKRGNFKENRNYNEIDANNVKETAEIMGTQKRERFEFNTYGKRSGGRKSE